MLEGFLNFDVQCPCVSQREKMSFLEAYKLLSLPLKGTNVSWRFFLDIAQRKQSELFFLHVFECMGNPPLQKAAAALLEEKDPLTGQEKRPLCVTLCILKPRFANAKIFMHLSVYRFTAPAKRV